MNNIYHDNKQNDNARLSSGFTTDINKEISQSDPTQSDNSFQNLKEFYVSHSGHARLFSATRYGKRYMLKCLKTDYRLTPIYQQALRKEFEIGLQLDHPNICHTIGIEDDEMLGSTIVMEYIDGDNLQSLIDKHLISAELARKIVSQLMDALEYLHNKQIIHRDLKPSNIMITHTGNNVKLIDFGLSDSDSFFILKQPAGTSGYIAPELLLSDNQSMPSADIYSLGMVVVDLIKACGDKKLERIAQLCTIRDVKSRPQSISQLRHLLHDNSNQKYIVWTLAALCISLLASIAATYYYRSLPSSADSQNVQAADTTSQGRNIMIDASAW